jgi:predicted nucleic acid-binding protein
MLQPLSHSCPKKAVAQRLSSSTRKTERSWSGHLRLTEVISALCRKARAGFLNRQEFKFSRDALLALSRDWTEVATIERVREQAHRLLEIHPLRAADALQLASALIASTDQSAGFGFVTFDDLLATAAESEGFAVFP